MTGIEAQFLAIPARSLLSHYIVLSTRLETVTRKIVKNAAYFSWTFNRC
jgi:hypothetical protein